MKRFLSAAAVAAMFTCSWVQADVLNGGFESGTPNDGAGTHYTRVSAGDPAITGWSVLSGNVDWFSADAAPPCTGNRSLELNGNTNGAVSQSFATTPGAAYRVTFCLAGNPNGPPAVKTLEVGATGNPPATYQFDTTGLSVSSPGWVTRAYAFTATGASTTLTFTSRTTRDDGGLNAFGPMIDSVVVVEDRFTRTLTDQWWIEVESGWGAAVLQQGDTLFIDLFVYGLDGKPTWFVAAAIYQSGAPGGHVVFAGDLYTATGPYYGGPFGAAPVVGRKVGTLTFDSATPTTATLTYTVDGTPVTKNVTRQTWGLENIAGTYFGGAVFDQSLCADATDNHHLEFLGPFTITHSAANVVSIVITPAIATINGVRTTLPAGTALIIDGNYAQAGHTGAVQGSLKWVIPGDSVQTWTVSVFDIERTISGTTGRFSASIPDQSATCRADGQIGGVRH